MKFRENPRFKKKEITIPKSNNLTNSAEERAMALDDMADIKMSGLWIVHEVQTFAKTLTKVVFHN